jgi:ribosomal protein S12 methylthiotransferase
VLIDRVGDVPGQLIARAPWQADDIDGVVYVRGDAAPGSLVDVRIDQVVDDYDFSATWRALVSAPPAQGRRMSRELPLAGGAAPTAGSFGR